MTKATIEVGQYEKGGYLAVAKTETTYGLARFYGFGKTVVEASEKALASIRDERRPFPLGRTPRRYKIARALR